MKRLDVSFYRDSRGPEILGSPDKKLGNWEGELGISLGVRHGIEGELLSDVALTADFNI